MYSGVAHSVEIKGYNASTSIMYSAPSYSRIMHRRHCGCRGLLVEKRVQEVWEETRKKGGGNQLTGKIDMKKKRKINIT